MTLDLPYEDQEPSWLPPADYLVASGVLVAGVMIPTPFGVRPGLMLRFAKPDGSGFHDPMLLLIDEETHAEALGALVAQAAAGAIAAWRRGGTSP